MGAIQKGPADKTFRTYSKPALKTGTAIKRARVSFLQDLSVQDLERLRAVVRRVHLRHYKGPITERKIDMIIESLGPQVREKLVRLSVDKVLQQLPDPHRAADPDVLNVLDNKHRAAVQAKKRFIIP